MFLLSKSQGGLVLMVMVTDKVLLVYLGPVGAVVYNLSSD